MVATAVGAGIAAAGSLGAAAISSNNAPDSGGGGVGRVIPNFRAGGLRLRATRPDNRTSERALGLGGQGFILESSEERQALVDDLGQTFANQAGQIGDLREQVRPGFGRLTEARVQSIANARDRGISNLRENLSRRRVLGSSFGADALTRAETEFAQQEERARAQSFLQELDLTNDLINQEFEARRGEFQTALDELNLQADIANQLASGATSQLGANARLKQRLAAQAAQGRGRFFGQVAEPFVNAASNFAEQQLSGVNLFGGGGVSQSAANQGAITGTIPGTNMSFLG